MEEALVEIIAQLSWPLLALLIAVCLAALGKGADWLVEEAVALSERSGIPKVVIGATIVSVGTTTPEAVVSVLAAVQGKAGLALGNAVGSIICDTGLILGVACLIRPLPLDPTIVNRQGWIQIGAGFLLVAAATPWGDLASAAASGGRLPRAAGVLFLLLLAAYLWQSVRWSRREAMTHVEPVLEEEMVEQFETPDVSAPLARVIAKLLGAIGVVVASSWVVIPAVSEAATRMNVPESVIAATMVAFGTSLPELVTSVTAARRGHGELAVGNVVGADILNVLFVAGAAAAVTPGGLAAPGHFFTLYFPSMLLLLVIFRVGIFVSGDHLRRPFGAVLLAAYALVTVFSYVGRGEGG